MITRQTSLSKNIIRFCIFLRTKGFNTGMEEEAAALQALQFIDFNSSEVFLLALQSVLCRSKAQIDEFDQLFNQFWKELDKAENAKQKKEAGLTKPPPQAIAFKSLKAWLHGNRNDKTEETASYSLHENLSRTDFSTIPADQTNELLRTIKALSRRLAAKTNRRYSNSAKIAMPDLRQTLRKNMRLGGELLNLAFRQPKRNRIKLVMLCDVSQSMELYSVFLLQFMYGFQQVFNRMHTFVFSTALKKITSELQQKDFRETLHLLGAENSGWAGGTRIGESLQAFIIEYAKKLVDSKTIIIILSDGWDTGNISALEKSMELLHKRSRKIIWLNPLAGNSAYRPEAAGMKAAMPFIDVFAPVHNVESLRKLGRMI